MPMKVSARSGDNLVAAIDSVREAVMAEQDEQRSRVGFDFYAPQYARFSSPTAAEVRREAYGEDIGQQNWQSVTERAEVVDLLRIDANSAFSTLPAELADPRSPLSSAPDVS